MNEKKDYRNKKLLYHMTALDNLESILKYGLLSRFEVEEKKSGREYSELNYNNEEKNKLLKVDVADDEIIQKRRKLEILNLVPFHFFEPTPFAYCIFHKHPEKTFVTIAVKRNLAKAENFKISTRHPLNPNAKILTFSEGIEEIDWDAMGGDFKDEGCKSVSMAECLFPSPVSPDSFFSIYVPDEEVQDVVESLRKKMSPNSSFKVDINKYLSRKASGKEDSK